MAKQRFYHWSAAFRIQHWLHLAAILTLVFTGFYIHSAFYPGTGESMAWNMWFHFVGAYVLVFAFILRVYLMFNSYEGADWKEILPLWRNVKHIPDITAYYLFMKDTHRHYHRYNPLQALAYTAMGLCVIVMACTGFALSRRLAAQRVRLGEQPAGRPGLYAPRAFLRDVGAYRPVARPPLFRDQAEHA